METKTQEPILGLALLKAMPPRTIFATGVLPNSPDGLYMVSGEKYRDWPLRWVACRGEIHDWSIYAMWEDDCAGVLSRVHDRGDKLMSEENIRRCVPCDDAALAMYRY